MRDILQESIEKLKRPTERSNRILIITFNTVLILGMLLYMLVGEMTEGYWFASYLFFFTLMLPPLIINGFSLVYNLLVITRKITGSKKYDRYTILSSMITFMLLTAVNITGYENSGIDLIITNFALSYTLMYFGLFTIGRTGTMVWYIIVLILLITVSLLKGTDYEYHFLTDQEVITYKEKLAANDAEALARERQIEKEGKRQASHSRYVAVWLIFLTFGVTVAWNHSQLLKNIRNTLPEVVQDINAARQYTIETTAMLNREMEFKKREQELLTSLIKQKDQELNMRLKDTIHINQLLTEVEHVLKGLPNDNNRIESLLQKIDTHTRVDQARELRKSFNEAYPDFIKELTTNYNNLSDKDLQHCIYLKLGLNSDQIAELTHVDVKSLRNTRYRIKKKLGLASNGKDDLKEFIAQL